MYRDIATRSPLVAVLSNPPATDGRRTIRRVELAATLLGFDNHLIVNLFAHPSHATGDLSALGVEESGWSEARPVMANALNDAGGVLLGYGATEPTGPARVQFRAQVDWLAGRLSALTVPVWQLGDGPRHPSRWQRWTWRVYPDVPFEEAVRLGLGQVRHGSTEGRR